MAVRFLSFAAILATAGAADAAPAVAGRWLTQDGSAVVTIRACGLAMCGRIGRLVKEPPADMALDRNNPNPALRGRPLEGLAILTGFIGGADDWRGRLYDPRSGRTYGSTLRRDVDGRLRVQACVGVFCRTQHWTPTR